MDFEPEEDEGDQGEIAISFSPRYEQLAEHAITAEQFESALLDALQDFEAMSAGEDVEPDNRSLEEMMLQIGGKAYRLGDLADIEIDEDAEEDFDEEEAEADPE